MKSAAVGRELEEGERFGLAILNVGDALGVNGPVVALALPSLKHVLAEGCAVDVGKQAVHALCYAVYFVGEQRVATVLVLGASQGVLFPRHKVHKEFILWQRGGQHLSVGRQDVASGGQHFLVLLDKTFAHGHPVTLLHRHDVKGFAQNGNAQNHENGGHERIALHDFLCRKIHSSSSITRLNEGVLAVCNVVSSKLSSMLLRRVRSLSWLLRVSAL